MSDMPRGSWSTRVSALTVTAVLAAFADEMHKILGDNPRAVDNAVDMAKAGFNAQPETPINGFEYYVACAGHIEDPDNPTGNGTSFLQVGVGEQVIDLRPTEDERAALAAAGEPNG